MNNNDPQNEDARVQVTASLRPSDMLAWTETYADMTLEQVLDIGEVDWDRPMEAKELSWESVRTRVLGFTMESVHMVKLHRYRGMYAVNRLMGRHGLAILQGDSRVKGVEEAYGTVKAAIQQGRAGDGAVKALEATSSVQYPRTHYSSRMLRLASYTWVSENLRHYSAALGLSVGQLYLACCILSLTTHPGLGNWSKSAMAEDAEAFWDYVEDRLLLLDEQLRRLGRQ